MKTKSCLLLVACFLMAGITKAQTEVTAYQPGVTIDGVNYFLPRTAMRVTVVAEKTVVTPGRLNAYAFRYLRMQDVPTEQKTTWKIKSITLEPYAVPDVTKAYNVKLKQKTPAPLVSLTHDGILLAINAEKAETSLPALPTGTPAKAPLDAQQYLSQEALSAGSTAKLAEICAQDIYDIRESRSDLVRGQSDQLPKDGEQLRLMLEQLDLQSQALSEMFSGYTQTSTEVYSFNYMPDHATERDILFRFSEREGMVDADDLLGAPVYVSVTVASLPEVQQNPDTDKKKAKMQPQGIFYNVPARTKVSVFDLNETYVSQEVPMGQFGIVEILTNALFDKHMNTRVFFHQLNGGIERLEQ